MIATREQVKAEALTWLRTPYKHHARLKGVGADCAQMPIAVYSSLGLIPEVAPSYVRDWHLHRSEELYLGWVMKFSTEIDRASVGPGDFGLWKYGRTFSHGAIIIEPPVVIHAYLGRNVELIDMDGDEELRTREARFFTLWGE